MPGYLCEFGQVESCRGGNQLTLDCVALATNSGVALRYNFTSTFIVLTVAFVVGSVATMLIVASWGLEGSGVPMPLGLMETVNELTSVVPVRGPLTCIHPAVDAGGVMA